MHKLCCYKKILLVANIKSNCLVDDWLYNINIIPKIDWYSLFGYLFGDEKKNKV